LQKSFQISIRKNTMTNTLNTFFDTLRTLGPPASLSNKTDTLSRLKNNGHVHLPPNFSAFDSVEQVLDLAAREGLSVLGASNYYDFSVYSNFADLAQQKGIFPLFGLELIVHVDDLAQKGANVNDPGVPGKMYFCGKGITRFSPLNDEASALQNIIRTNDGDRIQKQVLRMAEVFELGGVKTDLTTAAIVTRIAARHSCPEDTVYLQERHVVQVFQERIFEMFPDTASRTEALERVLQTAVDFDMTNIVAVQNGLRAHLMKAGKAAFVDSSIITFEQGHRLVLALGGIPCYPVLIDGVDPIAPYEEDPDALVADLKARNVHFVEVIPLRNDPEVLTRYVTAMHQAGMVVAAGTEHNTLDLVPLEPTCEKEQPIPEALQDIFWEGSCVIAAHQFLNLHGQCGYVNGDGHLNPDYTDVRDRIDQLAQLGAAVIHRYRDTATA
jgi:hypothetical protein